MYTDDTLREASSILGYGINYEATTATEREYPVIDGVVYTDVFTGTATVDGVEFTPEFNGNKYDTAYYNELHIKGKCKSTVKVTAKWGSNTLIGDLTNLLDWLTNNQFGDRVDGAVTKSIRIKDTAESFATGDERNDSIDETIRRSFGYYIRRPMIISFGENKDAARYF